MFWCLDAEEQQQYYSTKNAQLDLPLHDGNSFCHVLTGAAVAEGQKLHYSTKDAQLVLLAHV